MGGRCWLKEVEIGDKSRRAPLARVAVQAPGREERALDSEDEAAFEGGRRGGIIEVADSLGLTLVRQHRSHERCQCEELTRDLAIAHDDDADDEVKSWQQ